MLQCYSTACVFSHTSIGNHLFLSQKFGDVIILWPIFIACIVLVTLFLNDINSYSFVLMTVIW